MGLLARVSELCYRLSTLGRRDALDAELREEMRFHQELLARDLQSEGAPPAVAAATARRRFGNPTMLQEEARESWGLRSLDAIARDTRHASAPGFEVYRRAASLASAAAERPWDVNVL